MDPQAAWTHLMELFGPETVGGGAVGGGIRGGAAAPIDAGTSLSAMLNWAATRPKVAHLTRDQT